MSTVIVGSGPGWRAREAMGIVPLGPCCWRLAWQRSFSHWAGLENVDLVLLTAVVAVATTQRARPVLGCCPHKRARLQLLLHSPDPSPSRWLIPQTSLPSFSSSLLALITGNLAARARAQALAASRPSPDHRCALRLQPQHRGTLNTRKTLPRGREPPCLIFSTAMSLLLLPDAHGSASGRGLREPERRLD